VVLSLLMRANFGLRRRAEIWCLTRFTRFVFQDALELRIYLHNRSLMKYAEKMEASGIDLIDLMSMKPAELVSKFGMKKTQAATFVDTTLSCGIEMPPDLELPRGPTLVHDFADDRCSEPGERGFCAGAEQTAFCNPQAAFKGAGEGEVDRGAVRVRKFQFSRFLVVS
jgi:hypothetical protein